jgi:hypothetical protein
MKRPSFQFYPSDWLRDTALRSCSTGARGLWIDMICYMHEGNPYGHLKVGNKVIHFSNLARMVGESEKLVEQWLNELFEAGVYDLSEDGSICSRRMIKDENLRNIRAAGGKLGGNPLLKDKHKDNHEVKQKTTPSSTSSSTSSSKNNIPTPEGVSIDLWNDFMVYRKRLKAPVTDRVLARLVKEAELAKMPLSDVLETIIFKGWRSFEASWIQQAQQKAKELPLSTDKQIEEAYRLECGGDPTQARFNSYFDMKKFILEQRDKRARA